MRSCALDGAEAPVPGLSGNRPPPCARNAGVTLELLRDKSAAVREERRQRLTASAGSDERWGWQNEFLPSSPLVLFARILRVPEGDGCALPGMKVVGIVSA